MCKAPHKPLTLSTYSFLCAVSWSLHALLHPIPHIQPQISPFPKSSWVSFNPQLSYLTSFCTVCVIFIVPQRQPSTSKWVVFKYLKVPSFLFGPQDAFINSEIVPDCIFQIWLQQYLLVTLSRTFPLPHQEIESNFPLLGSGQAYDSLCNQQKWWHLISEASSKEESHFFPESWTCFLKLSAAMWADWVSWAAILCTRSQNQPRETGGEMPSQPPTTPASCCSALFTTWLQFPKRPTCRTTWPSSSSILRTNRNHEK